MTEVVLFRGTTGLNTRDDPVRLSLQPGVDQGLQPLARALNIVIEPSGRPTRCIGNARQASGNFHSLWCGGGDVLVVKDGYLSIVHPDYTFTSLRTVDTEAWMSYVYVRGRSYYANGIECGYVKEGANHTWSVDSTYIARLREKFSNRRTYASSLPIGRHLEYLNGRMYIAKEDTVWISERFYFGTYWLKGRHLHFNSDVSMIKAVSDGLWISDQQGIYWISGIDPIKQNIYKMADYSTIEYANTTVSGHRLSQKRGFENLAQAGQVAIFLTTQGVCIGGPSGFFQNITQENIEHDKSPRPFRALKGAAMEIGNQIIFTTEP